MIPVLAAKAVAHEAKEDAEAKARATVEAAAATSLGRHRAVLVC